MKVKACINLPTRPPRPTRPPPPQRDCIWGAWVWGRCSATCGGGIQTGTRGILQQASGGGTPCTGPVEQERDCNEDACPMTPVPGMKKSYCNCDVAIAFSNGPHISTFLSTVDCVYGPWIWEACQVTCGDSIQRGRRGIVTQAVGTGQPCNEPLVDFRACSTGVLCPGMNLLQC